MKRTVKALGLCSFVFALFTGCDTIRNASQDPEERINAAMPLASEIATSKAKADTLLEAKAEKTHFELEFSQKLKLRALTCAPGVALSVFQTAEDIRRSISNPKCFAEFDRDLLKWIGLRRVALLLNAPPLQPLPDKALPILTATNTIQSIDFAETAGVALITSNRELELIDISSDKSILLDKEAHPFIFRAALSPNGRVFSVASQSSGSEGVRLRESATGEVLAELSGYDRFVWLDANTAWITRRGERGSDLLDLPTGKIFSVKGISNVPTQLIRLPEAEPIFAARSNGLMSKFSLRRMDGEPTISLLGQQATPAISWSAAISTVTPDGRFMVQGSGKLVVTDLSTMSTTEIDVAPFSVQNISPLIDDQVLLSIPFPSGNWGSNRLFAYDVGDKTFAPIESALFTEKTRNMAPRTVFIASLGKTGVISGSTMTILDDVPHGIRYGFQAFMQQMSEEDRQLKSHLVDSRNREALIESGSRNAAIAGTASAAIAKLAETAQIEAVGVYKSAAARGRPGQPAPSGPVIVLVRKSSKPIILVLSSYDSVNWQIHVDPRAQLKAVLMAGYEQSSVVGADAVPNITMGRVYAYERDSAKFPLLDREVLRWTGKSIDTFQGKYESSSFTVGGL